MNKIININLAGRLIPIDELAYETLHNYLSQLKNFFSQEEGGDEILRDMEDRIGELFQDKLKKGSSCILPADVSAMMKVMGSPEQIEQETSEDEIKTSTRAKQTEQEAKGEYKRLHRSKQDSLIGGVCGGIAQYFGVDPIIVRLAFVFISLAWGAGILVYLLLWALLPIGTFAVQPLKRRLYRNPDKKVVGGVCGGLAAYLNIDPVIPRVIFAMPLLGMLFFGILDEDIFFFPIFTGGLPTLVLLYIILWISLPVATTVTEKLEMRGEKVDVQNLSQAIKNQQTPEPENHPNQNNGLRKAFSLVVKIFVFLVLGFILIILSSVLIAVVATLLGLSSATYFAFPLRSLITDNPLQQQLLWISLLLVLVLPFFALVRLLVSLFSGRRRSLPKWLNISLVTIFIAAIFTLFGVVGLIAGDFKMRYTNKEVVVLSSPTNDTLVIKQLQAENGSQSVVYNFDDDLEYIRFVDDSTMAFRHIRLLFTESPDSLYRLTVHRSAYGGNTRRAQELAESIPFTYFQEGNVLYIPEDFVLPRKQPYRNQKINLEIEVPKGKVFRTENLSNSLHRNYHFKIHHGRFRYEETYENKNWQNNRNYQMGDSFTDYSDKEVYED